MKKQLFESLVDEFLNHLRVQRKLSPNTVAAYGTDLRFWLQALRERRVLTLDELTGKHIKSWLEDLSKAGRSPASQSRALSAVRRCLAFAVDQDWITENPAVDIHGPKFERRLPVAISKEQMASLLAAPETDTPEGLRDAAALELLYASGLRASELCALTVDEVNLELGVVRPTAKGQERLVPMGKAACAAMQAYLDRGRTALLRDRTTNRLFVGLRSLAWNRNSLYKMVRRYASRAGINRAVSPHHLRPAFAAHQLEGGADLRSLQEMLGHADISTTEIYRQVSHLESDESEDDSDEARKKSSA